MSSEPNQNKRKYSARMFSRASLLCPRCRGEVEKRAASCAHCGFDFATCEQAFPFAPPPLSLVIDPARLLPAGIEGDVQGADAKLRKRFPQVGISFCFVRLQEGIATQEFCFWLHNSAPGADESRAWQGLVVGDLNSGQIAFTAGYALEPFIWLDQWEAALQELAACVADEQWKEGLRGFLLDARNLLTAAWANAEQRRKNRQRRPSEERQHTTADSPAEAGGPVADAEAGPKQEWPVPPNPPERATPPPPVPRADPPKAMEDAISSR